MHYIFYCLSELRFYQRLKVAVNHISSTSIFIINDIAPFHADQTTLVHTLSLWTRFDCSRKSFLNLFEIDKLINWQDSSLTYSNTVEEICRYISSFHYETIFRYLFGVTHYSSITFIINKVIVFPDVEWRNYQIL